MTSKVKKYSILIIAAVLIVAMAFAGAASAIIEASGGDVDQQDETTAAGKLALVNDLREALGMPALSSVTDTVVELPDDIRLTGEILFKNGDNSHLVLDLHGHNITSDGGDHRFAHIGSDDGPAGKFTLIDSVGGGNISGFNLSDGGGGCVKIIYGTFNMTGGNITNCTAADGDGGGVYNLFGTFNMTGNAQISYCKAEYGGGVYNNEGTFNMTDNAQISYCNAEYNGGGVDNLDGTFNMTGNAQITHCNANKGGGVYNYLDFIMSGNAQITYCNADKGEGVYQNRDGSFTMGGSATITSDVALIFEEDDEMLGKAKDAAMTKDDGKVNGKVFYPIILDTETTFSGSVSSISLYYYDEEEEEGVENPSVWLGQPVVVNGGTVSNKFALSTKSAYSGYTLKKSGSDLVLAKKSTYVPSHSKQTGSTVILQEGQVAPNQVPTATPTAKPTVTPTTTPSVPTINPTTLPTTKPTQKSPAPFVGIIAGLGAALVLTRLRK